MPYCMGYTYTEKLLVYLKLKFNWMSCLLSETLPLSPPWLFDRIQEEHRDPV